MSVFQTCLTFVWRLPSNFTMDYIASSDKCLTFHCHISRTLPYATYETVGRPRHSQILVRLATQNFLLTTYYICVQLTQTATQLCWSGYENKSLSLIVGLLKIYSEHPANQVGGPLGDPGFFVSCSTVLIKCNRNNFNLNETLCPPRPLKGGP